MPGGIVKNRRCTWVNRPAVRFRRWPCLLLVVAFLAFHAGGSPVWAALHANADILFAKVDATTYRYSIDLQNTGTTTIGTFWYAWVPGEDFLPTSPTNIQSPTGWSAFITGGGANNGFAIEWLADDPIAASTVQGGFGFDAVDSPTQLLGHSPTHPTQNVGTSFVYEAAPLADPGFQFTVNPVAHPWNNPVRAVDVNRDRDLSPTDAILVINDLNANGFRTLAALPQLPNAPPPFIDTNADDFMSPQDALAVIDALNIQAQTESHFLQPHTAAMYSAADYGMALSVPEPSAISLAAIGILTLAAAGAARRKSA